MAQYEYGFEIESILKQFTALIDKAIVLRYEKVENERRLVQTITPTYKFATKSRALLLSINSAKSFTLPCVVIEVTGIKGDRSRITNKQTLINRYENQILEGYSYPTPIEISLSVNIITKYKSDLFQIYGNLASQFQPECFISWMVPTNAGIKTIEELRNKVEWDFDLNIDSKESLKEDEEERYTGKMSFTVQGWIFHNHKCDVGPPIFDIGTTELVSNELENRIDGLIDEAAPLTSIYGSTYKNPRQFATSHVRILKAFNTIRFNNKEYHFRISENNYGDFKINDEERDYHITFDGYNLYNVNALLVPKNDHNISTIRYTFDDSSKLTPKIGESTIKNATIEGIPIDVVYRSNNTLKIKLPKIDYVGNFDIILYDRIDYDSFSDAEGFSFHAIN